MRDVFLERGFAAGLFLLLWLYYRWLEHVESKQRLARREKKQQQERKGSIPIPGHIQWKGTSPGHAFRPEHYLESHFALGVTSPTGQAADDAETEEKSKEAREAGFR